MEFEANISLPLDRFTLSVAFRSEAHVMGIFGPSGSGKSSFVEAVAGLRREARGQIRLGEDRWLDTEENILLPPEERGVGYVPQAGLLFPHLSVRQNLRAGARRAGQRVDEVWNNVVDLLELGMLLERDVCDLSGGERQRVALGRALCSAPQLLLLDEPLAALDQPLRRRILPFLRRIREEFAIPMILVTHDPIEVQALCDDLVVLREGRMIARGAPREVLIDPAVFPLSDRGFENIIPCTTLHSDEWTTEVNLGSPPTNLTLKLLNIPPGRRSALLVGIPARDMIVATQVPKGISARNVLPAVVEATHPIDALVLVQVRLDHRLPSIAVEVGRESVDALQLREGTPVFLIVKAMACTLYEDFDRKREVNQ